MTPAVRAAWFFGRFALAAAVPGLPAPLIETSPSLPASRAATKADDLARRPQLLVALATSNQIAFRPSGSELEAVCLCGPKVYFHQMSEHVREAVVAVEDRRFWYHRGVDPNGVLRSLWNIVTSLGEDWEGGSTITQQLIKNTVLTSRTGIARKTTEARLAYALETTMRKSDILEAYLNQMVFAHSAGRPIVGIEQASRYFFGRRAGELNLRESAILAGLLKAPSELDPSKDPDAALARAAIVLTAMVEAGYITARDKAFALSKKGRRAHGPHQPIFVEARSFSQWVLADVRHALPDLIFDSSTRIPITLEVISQAQAEGAYRDALKTLAAARIEAGYLTLGFDGRVVVMIGQRDFTKRQINFVTQTNSQPASTFKPFVYAAAFEHGAAKPGWKITSAFARSDNELPQALAAKTGLAPIIAMAQRAGIDSVLRADKSLVLGTSEVSLLELTGAYLPFATKGRGAKPYGYLGVIKGGRIVAWPDPAPRQVMPASVAATLRAMLREVVLKGTGMPAQRIRSAAGKSGTSDSNRDAWFIGMTGRHVSGLWIGRADNSSMPGITGTTAASVWAKIEAALPNE